MDKDTIIADLQKVIDSLKEEIKVKEVSPRYIVKADGPPPNFLASDMFDNHSYELYTPALSKALYFIQSGWERVCVEDRSNNTTITLVKSMKDKL